MKSIIVALALMAAAPAWAGPVTSQTSQPSACKPGEVMVKAGSGPSMTLKCEAVPRLIVPPVPREGDICVVRNGVFHCYTPRKK
jgi:hypothetical protein